MRNYYKIESVIGEILILEKDGVTSFVPQDETNPDYQAYLNPDKVEHLTEIPTPEQSGTL